MMAVLPEAAVRDRLLLRILGATAGVGLLLAVVALWLSSHLKRRVRSLVEQCDRLAIARGSKPAVGLVRDELEELELALRQLIQQVPLYEQQIREETARAVQAEERQKVAAELQQEAEASEQEVGVLLEVVSSIEEGDLTVEAEVSDHATGLVADTLNRLRERLAETIASVLATAQQVAAGAEELQVLARTVAANTVDQAQSVAQGTALTEQVAASAKSSAEQVKIANQALQEVQKTVESAQSAITKLTEGIAVLQKGSSQIVQRMKTLGEFVGLAEQFVQDQSQIASLTQVLAINATLVAARAAEQRDPKQFIGVAREFEAIADQVNALATQTNQGLTLLRQRTGQIQAVVSAVDTEVQSLGGLVAGFTSGVEQSATAFQSVRQVTEQVVAVGQSVTSSSLEIATAADSTAKYMSEIATLAGQTANLTATARQKAETMGSIAQQLLAGIRFFRLPEAILAIAEAPAQPIAAYDIPSVAIGDTPVVAEFEEDDYDDYEDDEFDYTEGDYTGFAPTDTSDDHQEEMLSATDLKLEEFTAVRPVEDSSAVSEPIEELELEDDLELADFSLALDSEPETSVVDFDALDDAPAAEPSTELLIAEISPFSETAEQLELTELAEDDPELVDFSLVLEPPAETAVVDSDELEALEKSGAVSETADFAPVPDAVSDMDAFDSAEDDMETQGQGLDSQLNASGEGLELFTADGLPEPELPMNLEFDALVATLDHHSQPVPQAEEEGRQFAEDDFEEFMPTLAEDDGSTPFKIDFLVEEKY